MDEQGVPHSAILLVSCPDQSGLVATITRFIHENNGNIINLEQYVDPGEKVFFMRLEWDLSHFSIPLHTFGETFQNAIATEFGMEWSLHSSSEKPRMAIFVSTLSHCLYDILSHAHAVIGMLKYRLSSAIIRRLSLSRRNLVLTIVCSR
jgi:formyltetrahydrofolate deformylase